MCVRCALDIRHADKHAYYLHNSMLKFLRHVEVTRTLTFVQIVAYRDGREVCYTHIHAGV